MLSQEACILLFYGLMMLGPIGIFIPDLLEDIAESKRKKSKRRS